MLSFKRCLLLATLIIPSTTLAAENPPFASQTPPPTPDYQNTAAWAALPQTPGYSAKTPAGALAEAKTKDVDVFYVHPTTLRSKTQWNQNLQDSDVNHWTDVSVIARQASVFNDCCNIYAPRYRQASFLAGYDPSLKGDGRKAYELAYSDILRAFDDFQRRRDNKRPFIVAGHSQGALMVYWLLRDRIDNKPLQNNLVAAYVIGIDVMAGDFGRTYQSLELCGTPSETGCVLAWNAVLKEADISMQKKYAGSRYVATYGTEEGRQAVCINPVTFSAQTPVAEASASKGSVPGMPGEDDPRALVSGAVQASCSDGYLRVDVDPSLELESLPGGSMHYHEFGLFYEDIRENIAQRIESFYDQTAAD